MTKCIFSRNALIRVIHQQLGQQVYAEIRDSREQAIQWSTLPVRELEVVVRQRRETWPRFRRGRRQLLKIWNSWSISDMPVKSGLPWAISANMHPTDQISTAEE